MSELNQEEFKPCISLWAYVVLLCVSGGAGFAAWLWLSKGWKIYQWSGSALSASELCNLRWVIIFLILGGVLFVACALQYAFATVRLLLYARRGAIVLDAHGIKITNWRGQQKDISWARIQQVRVVTCGGLFESQPPISVKADRHTVNIPASIPTEARTRLLEEIISRAGLRESHHSWFASTYKRAPA